MESSDTLTKISAALREAQKNIDHVEKTSTNPHFGNTYTDLNAFLRAVRDPLADVGITMTQSPGMQDGWVTVETLLHHDSGEWIRSTAGAPMQKDDPQGVGSAITYLRRYSLAALLAIPQEDDDGNAASTRRSGQKGGQRRGRSRSTKDEDAAYHCPECGGAMWDNRADKEAGERSKKFPDFKCRDCDHPIWGAHPDDEVEDVDVDELAEEVTDLLDTAASLSLVTVERSANIEKAVKNKNADVLRIAHDWLERQIEKAEQDEDAEGEREPVPAGAEEGQGSMPF